MDRGVRVAILAAMVLAFVSGAAAIDINSSHELQYFSGNNLAFEVNQTGYITVTGPLDAGNNEIRNFFAGGPSGDTATCGPGEFVQQVFANGSYACASADTAQGQTFVNVSGDTMTGQLNMSNNSINNVSYINEFGNSVFFGGEIAMQNNRIRGLATPSAGSDAATKDYVDSTASSANTDNQNLSEVLVHGNVANMTIDMGANQIDRLGALYSDQGGTSFFSGTIAQSETISGINADGTIQTQSILAGSSNIEDGAVIDTKIAAGAVNTTHILDGTVLGADISSDTITASEIAANAVGGSELADTGNFDVNSIDIAQALSDGNISNTLTITGGSVATSTLDGTVTNDVNAFVSVTDPLSDGNISDSITIGNTGTVRLEALEREGATSGQVLAWDGTNWQPATDDTGTDNQNLSEVLVQGNVANMSIDMSSNSITNIGDLGGTGIVDGANILDGSVGTSDVANAAITANELAVGSVNESHILSSVFGNGISGGSGSQITVGAGTGLVQNTGGLAIDTSVVPRKGQDESISGYWQFDNNVTVAGDLNVLGNITNTDVENLNVNGSLLPPEQYTNTFDIGSSSRQWRDAYFGGDINVDGFVDGIDVGSPGNGLTTASNAYVVQAADGTINVASGGISVASDSLDDTQIVDNSLTAQSLATDSVESAELATGAVIESTIANGAVNTTHLQDSAVTGTKIATGAVKQDDIDTDAVGSSEIQTGAVGSDEIATDAVTNTEIAAGAVNNDSLDSTDSYDLSGLSLRNNRITDVQNPASAQDAATKDYVDSQAGSANQTLSEVLDEGNTTEGKDIDMAGGSLRSSTGEICIGDQCT